ncbi:pyridoxal phosphate-dependent aminotransferase [Brucella intermedia GD04153]|uniref:cysteine-S-conjugate beta-lyase n=1 Tax=Brucella intermedia GD04153 TaxID=2975438 RepID=A0AA42H4B8_9HYPH|nr:pyridoxal phosphate-dependent aminotransferase [Brucella intermedia]MDH0126889.1 pyridoxal phosphate-dependent aminotransferase [Brucella intermedia GD04153]
MTLTVNPEAISGSTQKTKFDFDTVVDRRSSNSMKWTGASKFLSGLEPDPELLAMWVADMDFRAPPAVLEALHEAVDHGVFGYPNGATASYLNAVVNWQGRRFGWDISPDWVVQTAGIIQGVKTAVQAFSHPGDSVLIQPPVYAHFREDVLANGRRITDAPLVLENGRYSFDPVAFERAILPNTKLFILCNPHNPTGNVWSADELQVMGEICMRHGVLVIADEIHEDIVLNPAKRHIPFASLREEFRQNSITCTSPSKTFNLAGLQSANVLIPNRRLREEYSRQLDRNAFDLVNVLGMVAAEAAYCHGEPWLEEMLAYVRANQIHFADTIRRAAVGIEVLPADSLYLAWMDCRRFMSDADQLNRFLLSDAKVWLDNGRKFGVEGEGFMRVNLACPRSTVNDALKRITLAISANTAH